MQRLGTRMIGNLGFLIQNIEHLVDIDDRLFDLAIDHAEKIQRDIELNQEPVDQHQVAQRQRFIHHTLCGKHHQQGHRDGDDAALANVQHAQRHFVFDRRPLIALQIFVVATGLEFLVIEVFDRLIVEQTVDRPRGRTRIEFVGLPSERNTPLGY